MPLLVTDYSWTQTETTVYIHVPLKGTAAGKVDVVSTDEYLKVHFPPYLFEAFLFEAVNDDRSSAKIREGEAVISLSKTTNNMWRHLMRDTDDKIKKMQVRERALLKYQEKLCSESRSKAEKQRAERKYALETMMKLEQEERHSIQRIKDTERQRTTTEMETWQLRQKQRAEEKSQGKLHRDDHNKLRAEKQPQGHSGQSDRKQPADLPAPRTSRNIQVTFTPRVFPTALRESRAAEEEEWLRKQAEARRAVNADVEELGDLKEEDRNPEWLKNKGEQNKRIPALYSNRAACHLKLGNLHKAIEDSSQALDLLIPPVAANAAARARASVRRGSAFCRLQLYAEGLQDYQAALKIDPHNEALQTDTQRIQDIIQGSAAKTH
ncbi:dynein axonemal assembly factor 4 isoform X2 [Lates calcarifer]|uniref:Dynein axonemal assembly factor 4 n=1 Tax=Lates calcarifer TaxID=8187 RepID=A0AAJ7LLZ0_LATCA|nr:dynein axonemal assembly factor 4 isoform X2 [Lates calcarifer]